LIAIAYAWVINPIREYKENKKFKEQNKKWFIFHWYS
jgi:hypothetical protein